MIKRCWLGPETPDNGFDGGDIQSMYSYSSYPVMFIGEIFGNKIPRELINVITVNS